MSDTTETEGVKREIWGVLQHFEPDLLPDELTRLTDEIEASFDAYASETIRMQQRKEDTEELTKHRKEVLSKSLDNAIVQMRDAIKREPPTARAEKRLRRELKRVLDVMNIAISH